MNLKTLGFYSLIIAPLLLMVKVISPELGRPWGVTDLVLSTIALTFLFSGLFIGHRAKQNLKEKASLSLDLLSDRENEVLQAAADGFSNAEIAESLFISIPTVKTHLSNIYMKLGVKRRTQAVKLAEENRTKTENHTLV